MWGMRFIFVAIYRLNLNKDELNEYGAVAIT
jgi:hypothetical protein